MSTLHGFSDQAARFATTRESHAQVQAHIERTIQEYRTSAAALAVECLLLGSRETAVDVMTDCLVEQLKLAKIRHLEVVR